MIRLRHFIGFIGLIGIVSCASKATESTGQGLADVAFSSPTSIKGMVWIPGGELIMGSDDPGAYAAEKPAVKVSVAGFWMEPTEVTNAQFQKFVTATGYLTVAERAIDWEELKKQLPPNTPKLSDEDLAPGSMVFVAPTHPVPLHDLSAWWIWVKGANWMHPEGPESNLEGRENHPDPNSFMQYNITQTAVSGGSDLLSGFVIGGSGGTLVDLDVRAALQLGRSGIGTISDTYTLVCASPNTNKKALAVLNWIEQR